MSIEFNLTYTQCKQIIETHGRDELEGLIADIKEQPACIVAMQPITCVYQIKDINCGGCESGAYMPAVTNGVAAKLFPKHADELKRLANNGSTTRIDVWFNDDTFNEFSQRVASKAVEAWCSSFASILRCVD